LQHGDGQQALERGNVDAWSGLDPMMATSELEHGSTLFFRNPDFNSYGILNVREEFAARYPAYVSQVIEAYERARADARKSPDQVKAALAKEAHLSDGVASAVLRRTDLASAAIGEAQRAVILAAGEILKKSGVVKPDVDVAATTQKLLDPSFTKQLAQA